MASGACGGSERSRRWWLGRGLAAGLGWAAAGSSRAVAQAPAEGADEQWGPFRGRVVDADTGEPIPGAVAVVIWLRVIPTPIQAHHEFFDARMAVSGRDGTFEIPRRSPPWFAFTIEPPLFNCSAPDYVLVGISAQDSGGRTIRMRRRTAFPPEERVRIRGTWTSIEFLPDTMVAQFTELANRERAGMGLPPIHSLRGGR
jgi:hypothetical protein